MNTNLNHLEVNVISKRPQHTVASSVSWDSGHVTRYSIYSGTIIKHLKVNRKTPRIPIKLVSLCPLNVLHVTQYSVERQLQQSRGND